MFFEFLSKSKKEENVIENLWKFPLLTNVELDVEEPDFVSELIKLLKIIGKQIKILGLVFPDEIVIDRKNLHDLCPELFKLEINDYFL